MRTVLALIAIVSVASAASCKATPAGLSGQLPAGYDVIASTQLVAGQPGRIFQIIALGRHNEGDGRSRAAPPRPLLIFERRGARFALAGRNDHVVMKADEGGQCDPFLDGNATIATKGTLLHRSERRRLWSALDRLCDVPLGRSDWRVRL